jgi:hypothetical protein
VPEEQVDRKGSYGCGDVGIEETIAPGATIEQRARWDGAAGLLLGPPPTGPIDVVGSFRHYWRQSTGEPADLSALPPLEVRLPAWIDGRVTGIIDPAEAIDAALADQRFVDVLESRDLWNANEPVLRYDPAAAAWQVGLLDHGDHPIVHLVTLDGHTGQNLGFVERAWDFDVDGFP